MMSRITLHLKEQADSQGHTLHTSERDTVVLTFARNPSGSESTAHTRYWSGSSTRGFVRSPTIMKPQSLCTIYSERSLEMPVQEYTGYTGYTGYTQYGWNYGPGTGYWGEDEE